MSCDPLFLHTRNNKATSRGEEESFDIAKRNGNVTVTRKRDSIWQPHQKYLFETSSNLAPARYELDVDQMKRARKSTMAYPSILPSLRRFLVVLSSCSFMFCGCARALSSSAGSSGRTYDVLIVGGGSAGLTAAKFAGDTLKKSVLIIEKEKLGGDCTWTGCVPSKSIIASAKASMATRRTLISDGKASAKYLANFQNVKERFQRNQAVIYEEDDSPEALEKLGVETISGKARLVSCDTLKVSNEGKSFDVTAKEGIILCTGAKPNVPKIAGLDSIDYVTYEGVWDLDELPKKLTVVGGGPVRTQKFVLNFTWLMIGTGSREQPISKRMV